MLVIGRDINWREWHKLRVDILDENISVSDLAGFDTVDSGLHFLHWELLDPV